MIFDERSSYVIFSIFFTNFILVLIQIKAVLEQLPKIFGTFCNFFHIESCNSSFPETKQFLGVFEVI